MNRAHCHCLLPPHLARSPPSRTLTQTVYSLAIAQRVSEMVTVISLTTSGQVKAYLVSFRYGEPDVNEGRAQGLSTTSNVDFVHFSLRLTPRHLETSQIRNRALLATLSISSVQCQNVPLPGIQKKRHGARGDTRRTDAHPGAGASGADRHTARAREANYLRFTWN